MNLNQAKQRNLKSFDFTFSLLFVFLLTGCADNTPVEEVFVPSASVNPNISLDCSGIWEGSPLCLERNEALLELRKLDLEFKLTESILDKNPILLDKVKSTRSEGDKFYNDEFYFKARDSYAIALNLIIDFKNDNNNKIKKYILDINNLLTINKIEDAKSVLLKAIDIDPLNDELLLLQSRVDNFYAINTLVSAANKYLAEEDYENALLKINNAIDLDSYRDDTSELKLKIISESNQYYFDLYIRNAYKNLNSGDIKRALFNAEKAKKIFSSNDELAILENSLSSQKNQFDLANFIKDAELFYQSEDWNSSLKNYKSALRLSPNDQNIKNKVMAVEKINKTYDEINIYIKSPERLSSSNIRNNFKKVINNAKNLNLTNELNFIELINTADDIYNRYSTMVILNIISNEKTFVDIQKTAQYQPFESEFIKLYPGKYIIIAKRKGMQSSRLELNLLPEMELITVTARCEQSCRVYTSDNSSSENSTYADIKAVTKVTELKEESTLSISEFISGAKINKSSFAKNLVCNKVTKNKSFKLVFSVSVKANGFVVATRLIGNSESNLSADDRQVISLIERALKKSRFRLPKVDGKTSAGKIRHPVIVPSNFCQE